MVIVGAISWLIKQNWIAVSLCAAGVLMLALAMLIARSKVRQYFVATLLTLCFGVFLSGAAIGATIPGILDEQADVAAPSAKMSAPPLVPPTTPPNHPSRPAVTVSPRSSTSTGPRPCATPPYDFSVSSVHGTIVAPNPVPRWFQVTGTLQNVPDGRTPFLVTELTGTDGKPFWDRQKCAMNRVWPVELAPIAGPWDKWIALGDDDSGYVGLTFKVTLLLVDEATKLQFRRYIEEAERTKKYPGVGTDTFEGTIEEVDSVTLTRK